MSMRFIGIDPSSEHGDSPTVWVDTDRRELLIQGWKATSEEETLCYAAGTVPGHAAGVPAHEALVRVPARMAHIIKEACDALARPDDH